MDRNIAALLREDARTVHVRYFETQVDPGTFRPATFRPAKQYTYVTHLGVKVGDKVVVQASGQIMIAEVKKVDEDVQIEPNDSIKYAWVISVVDTAAFEANMERNRQIEASVADAYRKNLRRSFAEQVLSGLTKAKRLEVSKLLK